MAQLSAVPKLGSVGWKPVKVNREPSDDLHSPSTMMSLASIHKKLLLPAVMKKNTFEE